VVVVVVLVLVGMGMVGIRMMVVYTLVGV